MDLNQLVNVCVRVLYADNDVGNCWEKVTSLSNIPQLYNFILYKKLFCINPFCAVIQETCLFQLKLC